MSCMAAIQTANTTSTATATNAAINLGTVQHRQNKCALSGAASGISLLQSGYYAVTATVTFTAPTTGVVAVSLQANGQQVIGATAAESVNTATTEQHTIAITGLVYVACGSAPVLLTLVNTGIAFTPSNVSITVVKTK